MSGIVDRRLVWSPQIGPQVAFMECPLPLVGFGGSRGGGKTDAVLGKFGVKATSDKRRNMVFFRQELPQADDLIERAREIYEPLGARFNQMKNQFVFGNGARIRFRPLANNADAQKYQGQGVTDAAVEEAGNYPSPEPIYKLFGCLRGVEDTQLTLTFNPGGSGHGWLREKFVKPAPLGMKVLNWTLSTGTKVPYIYIPSRITDNKILLDKDPGYIDRLHMVGSPELVRAWLEGDFEITEGSFFPEFGARHIIRPFAVPTHWPRYLGYDWGYRSPFAAVWGAVSSGKDDTGRELPYPKGALVIYRELWGRQVENTDQAEQIARLSGDENPIAVADPSIFNNNGGPSIADQFSQVFTKYRHPAFRRADNDRPSGWSQIRQRLHASPPMLYIFSSCPYLLETLPALQIDQRKPEDCDTTGDDHILDATRYMCKARLLDSNYKKVVETARGGQIQLGKYITEARNQQQRARV